MAVFTLDSARMMRHTWDTMRVWMRFLIFMEVKAEDEDGGDGFAGKT